MRTIRLKETRPGADDLLTPKDESRVLCDLTLEAGPFRRRADADGFLITGNERPAARENLILLGDSFLEGSYSHENHRFASLLENDLPEEWRVLNGGYSGTSSLHLLPQLSAKIPPLMTAGGALVIFAGQADGEVLLQPGTFWDAKDRVTPIRPPRQGSTAPWPPEEAHLRIIRALIATCQAFGFTVGVVASPIRLGDFSHDQALRTLYRRDANLHRSRVALRRQIQENARTAATEAGVPFLDGQSVVSPTHFYDLMHLNREGHHVFADALAEWLSTWLVPDAVERQHASGSRPTSTL